MAYQSCSQCGAQLSKEERFCGICGTAVQAASPSEQNKEAAADAQIIKNESGIKGALSTISHLTGSTLNAPTSSGEMVFIHSLPTMGETAGIGPVKYLLAGAGRLFKGFRAAFKDKKKLKLVIVMAILWLLLSLQSVFGIAIFPVRLVSFLTFANGGIGTGLLGAVGGTIGKGIFVYFIMVVVLPAFTEKNSWSGLNDSLRRLIGTLRGGKAIGPILFGIGSALIAYNFLTGNASLQNSMAGIAAFMLSLRALSSKAGFLRGFIREVLVKLNQNKVHDTAYVNRIIAGFTTGFALAVILSVTGINWVGYLTGLLFIIAAIVLVRLAGKSQGVL